MHYKKSIAAVAAVMCLAFGGLMFWYGQKDSLRHIGFRVADTEAFAITERFTPYFSEYDEESIVAEGAPGILHLTILSNIAAPIAEQYRTAQFLLFEGMFDQNLPPYPEFLTSATGCAEEFLPKRHELASGSYYTMYADERFNYGICDQSLAQYKAGIGIFYCEKQQKAVKIGYFIDKSGDFDTINAFMDSFVCDNN